MTYSNGLKVLIFASLVAFVSANFFDDNEVQDIRLVAAERECAKKYDLIEDFWRRPIKQPRNNTNTKDLRIYCFRKCLREYTGSIKPDDRTIDVERIINVIIKANKGLPAKIRNKVTNSVVERLRSCMEGVKVITCEDLRKIGECMLKPPTLNA